MKKLIFPEKFRSKFAIALFEKNIQSMIIEGGAKTIQSFIDANLWDEAFVFKGKLLLEKELQRQILKANLFPKKK